MKPNKPARRPQPATPHHAPAKPTPANKPTHWENVADWYDHLVGDQGSDYHQNIILPGVLRMLQLDQPTAPKSSPQKILDLACGQGVLCRSLQQESKIPLHITGIDASQSLLTAANQRSNPLAPPIRYLLADATKLLDHPTLAAEQNSFDALTCILAIQNMTPLSPIWQAAHALLKPHAPLILVLMHPCFRIPKKSTWAWDDTTQTQFRRIDQYLTSSKTPIQLNPSAGASATTTTTFHRPLQAYINTLGSHHLFLDHLEEWTSHRQPPPGPRHKPLDTARKEIPLFLALRARKISAPNT